MAATPSSLESPSLASSSPIRGWLVAASVGAAVLAVGVAEVVKSVEGPGPGWVVAGLLIATWIAAGVTLLHRACPLGRLALLGAVWGALGYMGFALRSGAVDGRHLGFDALAVAGIGGLPAVGLHLLLALPDGRLISRARRVAAAAAYLIATGLVIVWLAGSRVGGGWQVAMGSCAALIIGAWPANRRYLETSGVTRQRLQWIACAAAVVGEVAVVIGALRLLVGWPHSGWLAIAAASIAVPAAMLVAATPWVTRVDRLLVTTVSFAGLTLVVVGVYLLVVIGLGRTPNRSERSLLVLSMAAAAVAAVLYLPARERLKEQANRLVYGERHAPDESLKTFGSRLSRAIPMDELLLQLIESLRKTMGLASAEVWTGTDGVYELAVSVPDRAAAALRVEPAALPVVARAGVSGTAWTQVWLPTLVSAGGEHPVRVASMAHSGQLLGLLVLQRPESGDEFTEEEDEALGDLARQVALALHNVNLDSALQASLDDVRRYAAQLQLSRARIVATGDAERRRIERNLHDGAQQHLVALAVNLRIVRDVVSDNSEATELIDMLAGAVKDTIQELRDLAHGIYPPLLMDSGLPGALHAAADRSPLPVTLESDVGRHSTDTEAALYFCCLEAMQNAAKHAPDASLSVRIWEDHEAGRVCFEVSDDGPGFDPSTATAGHGYVNMSDRLGAIGGEVTWWSKPGEGAMVSGWAPTTSPGAATTPTPAT